jgi:hypothetical protein
MPFQKPLWATLAAAALAGTLELEFAQSVVLLDMGVP